MGPGVQDDPAAALPEGLAVLAPGDRRGAARPRGDRRDHQAALRQVVPPEQRLAGRSSAGSTRTRRWQKIKKLFGADPEGRPAAAQAATCHAPHAGRHGAQGIRVEVRRAAADGRRSTPSRSAHRTTRVLDVINDVLADGKTCRLYRKLVEDERIAVVGRAR